MKDNEYEEDNLDDFMVSASQILSEKNNPEKTTIIESLKQHLSSIFHIQNEMENFFKTLNGVIFTSKSSKNTQKIDNKQPFILYPLIFSFNPRTTSYFLDYYFSTLQQSMCEDNRPHFSFLSEIFADVVKVIFSDEKTNKNLIRKTYILEQNKRKNIYEKMINFCTNNIKTNKKVEQSFGCLLLNEFIENCPMVKEDKILDNLYKMISDYLDDRWFECKIDLLNCTISLIFAAEYKFKQYANVCVFRILDYLTDLDWMKRKLAINIVYTLVYYCRDEIMSVKDYILDFLNGLKDDPVEEVREVCMHALEFLGEEGDDKGFEAIEINNEKYKPKNVYNKYKYNYKNKIINKKNKLNISKDIGGYSQTIRSAKSNNRSQSNIKNIISNKKDENLRHKLQKEQEALDKMKKDFIEKKKNYSVNNKLKNNTITNFSPSNTINKDNSQNKSKKNFNKVTPFENKPTNTINSTINSILEQLKKLLEEQDEFRQMLSNLKQTSGNNYVKLNERLRNLEKKTTSRYQRIMALSEYNDYHEPLSQRDFIEKKIVKPYIHMRRSDEKVKIEELKNKFNNGGYNEALLETNQNDRYLLKLLPLINRKIIPKIEIALLEDAISRLNKRLTILCMEGDRDSINDVLQFYIQILKSKLELKLVTQLSINNALNFLKSKGISILTEDDFSNIDRIFGALRI